VLHLVLNVHVTVFSVKIALQSHRSMNCFRTLKELSLNCCKSYFEESVLNPRAACKYGSSSEDSHPTRQTVLLPLVTPYSDLKRSVI
jgi:hypothetical protein